jgi:hypothetical protein
MGGKVWLDEEKEVLTKMNGDGVKYNKIADILGRTHYSCQQQGKKIGLRGNINVNEDFFNQETEEKYYVLGYWLADGCISNKSGGYYFNLVSIDRQHLENIAKIMDVKTPICKRYDNSAYDLTVGNKKLVESIIGIGGTYRKTKTISLNNIIFDKKYFYTMLRGFFDGDGGYQFYKNKKGGRNVSSIKFTGSKLMINSIFEYIGYGKLSKDNRKNECYYLSFCGDKMRELLDNMYRNSSLYLERKYKIYSSNLKH